MWPSAPKPYQKQENE
jgi:hypothetical protein